MARVIYISNVVIGETIDMHWTRGRFLLGTVSCKENKNTPKKLMWF